MKRILSLILLAAILVLSFGCSGSGRNNISEADNRGIKTLKPLVVYYPRYAEDYSSLGSIYRTAAQIFSETYGKEVELYPSPSWEDITSGQFSLEEYKDKLMAEIISGNGPDIFLASSSWSVFWDIYKKIDAGAFFDLNKYLEKDIEFDFNLLENTVMDAGLYKEGRYIIPLSYQVPLLLVTQEKLTESGFIKNDVYTYDGFMSMWEKLHLKNMLLSTGDQGWASLAGCCGWLEESIDFENKTTDFDMPSFRRMIELMANETRIGNKKNQMNNQQSTMFNEGLFYCSVNGIGGWINSINEEFELNDNILLLSVPNAFGSATAYVDDYCLVSQTSANKDEVWDFVKILLSEELQSKWGETIVSLSAPVRSDCIDSYINATAKRFVSEEGSYTDNDGFKDEAKNIYLSYDNAVIPETKGNILYALRDYIYEPDKNDFDKLKAETVNYFKIYLSE